MARKMQLPSSLYEPNPDGSPRQYGPVSVDGLTKANTTALKWTATVEGWPTDNTVHLFTLRCEWNDGTAAEWPVNGGRHNRDGTPATEISEMVYVPIITDPATGKPGKTDVASGTMTLWAYSPFQTTFTLEAV